MSIRHRPPRDPRHLSTNLSRRLACIIGLWLLLILPVTSLLSAEQSRPASTPQAPAAQLASTQTPGVDASATTSSAVQLPAVWPQWRGPHRDGRADGAPWPQTLDGVEVTWEIGELGPSYSGPIVAEDRVFITETVDKAREVVKALDRTTGVVLWTQSWDGAIEVPFFAARNGSWIRSTPAYDGESLFVGGIREVLVSLDAETGEVQWKVDFPQRFGTPAPEFGFVASPLVTEDAVYLQAANSLVKLDKNTGETLWRTLSTSEDIMENGAFSSPVLAELDDQQQLVVQTRLELAGVDPASGEVLWRQEVPSFRGMNILTPTVVGDRVFTSTYRNASWAYDVKSDEVTTAWQSKVQAYMSSPLVVDDHIYLHLGNGRLTCLQWTTGEQRWTTEPLGKYWSLARQGERVLALNDEGGLLLFAASPEGFEIIDQKQISDQETWAHLAVAGDEIFVRELHGLKALRWSPAAVSDELAQEATAE